MKHQKSPDLSNPLYRHLLGFKPRKGDLKKAQILEMTIECLATEGLEATSFELIGKRLKMGRAHVAYYFDDRESLIEAAIQFAIGTLQQFSIQAIEPIKDPYEKLITYVKSNAEWAREKPHYSRAFTLLFYLASHDSKYTALHTEIRTIGAERGQALVKMAFPKTTTHQAQDIAKAIQVLITGYFIDFVSTQGVMPYSVFEKKLLADTQALLKPYTR